MYLEILAIRFVDSSRRFAMSPKRMSINVALILVLSIRLSYAVEDHFDDDAIWTKIGQTIYGEDQYSFMGQTISLSGNGRTLVLGSTGPTDTTGNVRVFDFDDERQRFDQVYSTILGIESGENFGCTTSVSYDGDIVAVGAYGTYFVFFVPRLSISLTARDSFPSIEGYGNHRGQARVFQRSASGWTQMGLSIDGTYHQDPSIDNFGFIVSLSANGQVLAVFADKKLYEDGPRRVGRATIYEWNQTNWVQVGTSINGGYATFDSTQRMALSADGTTLALTDPTSSYTNIFSRSDQSNDGWQQIGHLNGGNIVSLSSDGSRVAVSLVPDQEASPTLCRAYAFNEDDDLWHVSGQDFNCTGMAISMSSDGRTVAVDVQKDIRGPAVAVYHLDDGEQGNESWYRVGESLEGFMLEGSLFGFANSMSSDGRVWAAATPYFDVARGYAAVYTIDVDCNGKPLGTAFLDACGECVRNVDDMCPDDTTTMDPLDDWTTIGPHTTTESETATAETNANDMFASPLFYALCGVLLGSLVLVICCILFVRHRSRRGVRKELESLKMTVEMTQKELASRDHDLKLMANAWRLEWEDIELTQKLATGSFGEVWRGLYKIKLDVAVKKMFDTSSMITPGDDAEIHFLQRVRHPRLVMFYGAGRMPNGNLFVALELMELGGMNELLAKHADGQSLSWSLRVQLLSDIVTGMAFLHDEHNSMHRDLKSANILLSREKGGLIRGKIADFGFSRFASTERRREHDLRLRDGSRRALRESPAERSSTRLSLAIDSNINITMTTGFGTPTHMAPEVWMCMREVSGHMTKKIDVYSFGIIMWETLTLRTPWEEMKEFTYKIIRAVLEENRRPVFDASLDSYEDTSGTRPPDGYVTLMRSCWATKPNVRPGFSKVKDMAMFRLNTDIALFESCDSVEEIESKA